MRLILLFLILSVTVSAQVKVPAKIEAEAFSTQRLITVSTDTVMGNSGGKYITYMTGAWASFYLNVLTEGDYIFSFRVGDGSGGAVSDIRKSDGTILGSFITPTTGGLNVFRTVYDTVHLGIGKQTLRLLSVKGEYNLDWIDISLIPSVPNNPQQYASKSELETIKRTLDSIRTVLKNNVYLLDAEKFGWKGDSTKKIITILP